MFSTILRFFSHVFLVPETLPVFRELFSDHNPHYREAMGEYWALDGTFVALDYDEVLKREIELYKYHSQKDKRKLFAPYLSECFRLLGLEKIDRDVVVCPVPLHFWSRFRRGYSQSELLARDLAVSEDLLYRDILRKSRHTKHQARLGKSERIKNVRMSFALHEKHREAIFGKDVLIVDDVVSTGSTVNECARILREAGAKRVYAIFVATGG